MFRNNNETLTSSIDELFKCFKSSKKNGKHARVEDVSNNQDIEVMYKKNDVKVEFAPPDTPKLNNMIGLSQMLRKTK